MEDDDDGCRGKTWRISLLFAPAQKESDRKEKKGRH